LDPAGFEKSPTIGLRKKYKFSSLRGWNVAIGISTKDCRVNVFRTATHWNKS